MCIGCALGWEIGMPIAGSANIILAFELASSTDDKSVFKYTPVGLSLTGHHLRLILALIWSRILFTFF